MNKSTKIETKENIFTVTERGDRKIMEAHEHAIIFVGLTRVGKSTVFNWVLKKPMIGKGNLNSYFIPQVPQDADVAAVGNRFSSVTLAPNIYKDYEPKLSLVDMAGYQDTRNYVGVIGVSYFLKALFQRVRKVKFVIVFDENRFGEEACAGLIKTFQGFINMFNFAKMSDQIQKKMKNSLSVIVTRAKDPEHHYEYVTEILQKMQDPSFLFSNKELIIEILNQMKLANRIQSFRAAKDKQNPDECAFIPKFNARGWTFFDLDQNEAQIGESLITLPFTKDFQKLPTDQKEFFNTQLKNKVDEYLKYSDILKKLVQNFVGNWEKFLSTWKNDKVFNLNSFKLNELFDELKKFVIKNDVYGSDEFVSVELKVNYETPSFIKSIKSILKLEEIVSTASTIQDFQEVQTKVVDPETGEERTEQTLINLTFKDTMDKFKGYFAEMIKIIKVFAGSQDEELLLERTNFILQRGFREFQKLYELDSQMIHDVKIKLTGNCNSVFQLDNLAFRELFINQLNDTLLLQLFPSLPALSQYQSFFKDYSNQKRQATQKLTKEQADKVNIFLSEHQCTIEMAKADLLFTQLEKEKALQCFLKALKNIIQINGCVASSPLYEEPARETELNKLSMKKKKLIKKIISVLKSVSDSASNSFITYALQLSKHHFMIEETCQIYQFLIQSGSNNQRLKLYQDYSDYCLQWGRFQQARILLQKKYSIEEDSYEESSKIVAQLKKIQTEQAEYKKTYSQNLRNLGNEKKQDEELTSILSVIEGEVKELIKTVDHNKQLAKE